MNEVLEDILESGQTWTPAGNRLPISSAIPREEGLFLQSLIRELDPVVTLEIGLAYGVSALFICDAVRQVRGTRCIVIDPFQCHDNPWGESWQGVGLFNLNRAGLSHLVEFIDLPSHLALPKLEAAGSKIDFAFVDGWHTFDHTLMEFFYIDRLLKAGGVVAFDDADWPSVRKVCRYAVTNRAYQVFRTMPLPDEGEKLSRRRKLLKAFLKHPWWSTKIQALLKPERINSDRDLGLSGRCIALRKQAEDSRPWEFHQPF
jgi:predicted O-methyltransferase YrrM